METVLLTPLFLQPLFSHLSNYISHYYRGKGPDYVKGPKRKDEGRKAEMSQETSKGDGEQGF